MDQESLSREQKHQNAIYWWALTQQEKAGAFARRQGDSYLKSFCRSLSRLDGMELDRLIEQYEQALRTQDSLAVKASVPRATTLPGR